MTEEGDLELQMTTTQQQEANEREMIDVFTRIAVALEELVHQVKEAG